MEIFEDRSGRAFYSGLLEALIQAMGTSNGYLFHHGPRTALLATQIGQVLGLDRKEQGRLIFGGVLMDVGMIGLVEDAWENPVPVLNRSVRNTLECHPGRSSETVSAIPHLEGVAPLVHSHHEWWDGSGYPDGLAGDDIPLGAQVLRLADTVCALGEERPYREALPPDEIDREVRRCSGAEFSPRVVRAYLELVGRSGFRYDESRFRRALLTAADEVLPESISAISTEHLMDVLGTLVDTKDPYTGGHSRRVAALAGALAEKMGMDERVQRTAVAAGYVHDLGKVAVPLRVLTKEGELDEVERESIRAHPVTGAKILQSIPSLNHLTPAARYHHERWDGKGYPEKISGDRIPLVAQILAVCDSYDAMTSGRAYRDSRSHGHAMEEVDRCTGTHFGPRPSSAFLALPTHVFQKVKRDDPTGEESPHLPFSGRFHTRSRTRRSSVPT